MAQRGVKKNLGFGHSAGSELFQLSKIKSTHSLSLDLFLVPLFTEINF